MVRHTLEVKRGRRQDRERRDIARIGRQVGHALPDGQRTEVDALHRPRQSVTARLDQCLFANPNFQQVNATDHGLAGGQNHPGEFVDVPGNGLDVNADATGVGHGENHAIIGVRQREVGATGREFRLAMKRVATVVAAPVERERSRIRSRHLTEHPPSHRPRDEEAVAIRLLPEAQHPLDLRGRQQFGSGICLGRLGWRRPLDPDHSCEAYRVLMVFDFLSASCAGRERP